MEKEAGRQSIKQGSIQVQWLQIVVSALEEMTLVWSTQVIHQACSETSQASCSLPWLETIAAHDPPTKMEL